MSFHKSLTGLDIHVPFTWTYANAAARAAATGFATGDIGKFALQSDTNSLWMLTAVTPTWAPFGTVTSVGLSLPAELTVSGSPVTLSGTLAALWATQAANILFAGPAAGGAATPSFRALVAADIPALPESKITNLTTDLAATEKTVNKAAANGYASLDSGGKVPTSQLPAAVLGGVDYQGTWDANANTPTLASGTGTKGWYYKVSTAGNTTLDGNTAWHVGDWVVFDGTVWEKIDNYEAITSVAGRVGAITLANTDISGLGTSSTHATGDFAQTANNLSDLANAATARTNLGVAVQSISIPFNNGSSALVAGDFIDIVAEYACTINQVTLVADQSGSVVIDLRKCTYAQFDDSTHPVSGDSICASALPTLSSAVKAKDSTLTGWTTSLAAGDIIRAYIVSATTLTKVTMSLKVTRA